MREWVKLPAGWVEDKGLRQFGWGRGVGADHTAALMVLASIAHHADQESGIARMTYDGLCGTLGLSRASVSKGLEVLLSRGLISLEKQSHYQLSHFAVDGWAKFPMKSLYRFGRIVSFDHFHLRSAVQLNALRLYFLFAARRGRDTNMASISYDKIEDYTWIERANIRSAVSFLAANALIHVSQTPSRTNNLGFFNSYQLVGLESYRHPGTTGRGIDPADFLGGGSD